MYNEQFNRQFIGEYVDTIYHKDGRVEKIESHNVIINDIGKLIASLLKNHSGHKGLTYWAIGSGSASWDTTTPPVAQPTDTKCVNEIGRKAISPSNIIFIDEHNAPSEAVTNRIQVTVTFGESECNGSWREFALFGGNASSTPNSGIAINHKNHGVMVKTDSMVIERQIRFTFN